MFCTQGYAVPSWFLCQILVTLSGINVDGFGFFCVPLYQSEIVVYLQSPPTIVGVPLVQTNLFFKQNYIVSLSSLPILEVLDYPFHNLCWPCLQDLLPSQEILFLSWNLPSLNSKGVECKTLSIYRWKSWSYVDLFFCPKLFLGIC